MNFGPANPLLMTPGPTKVPAFVSEAFSELPLHHRSPEFAAFYEAMQLDLQYLFQTKSPVLALAGSGTLAIEAVLFSLFRAGEKIAVFENGKFAARAAQLAESCGLQVIRVSRNWGESISPEDVERCLRGDSSIRGIFLVHCETSTGAFTDLESLSLLAKEISPEVLIISDSISSIGALPFYMDRWKVDAAVVSTQKALMSPAGLAFIALSKSAQARLIDRFSYSNLSLHLAAHSKGGTAFTPSAHLLMAVSRALGYIRKKGLPAIWNEVHQKASECRKKLAEAGFEIFPQNPGDSLTVFRTSSGELAPDNLRKILREQFGVIAEGGQEQLAGRVIRVSHMGWISMKETEYFLQAVIAAGELK